MKIKMYTANWEVFHNDLYLSIDTTTDYINAEVYDSIEEVCSDIIDIIEDKTGSLTDDEKEEIKIACDIVFSSRF